MKVLVTGSAGKIGNQIANLLLENNNIVNGIDICPSLISHSNYSHFEVDLGCKQHLLDEFENCEMVVHSAIAINMDYEQEFSKAVETNIVGTVNLYKNALKSDFKKVVLLSSAPVDKEFPNPANSYDWKSSPSDDYLYDLTKRLQEEIAKDFYETYGIRTLILRIGHVVDGANEKTLDGNPLKGSDYCEGGWVDIGDVAQAVYSGIRNHKNLTLNVIGSKQAFLPFQIEHTTKEIGWEPSYTFCDL